MGQLVEVRDNLNRGTEAAFDRQEYQTVVLAALLHDIGKLHGRIESRHKGKHPIVSSEFVSRQLYVKAIEEGWINFDLLKTLVQRHHEHPAMDPDLLVNGIQDERQKALAYIVSRSDSCSSGERDESKREWYYFKKARLLSLLTRIDISRGVAERKYHNLQRLCPEVAFPVKFKNKADLTGTYEELAALFDMEITKLHPTSFQRLFDGYLSILRDFLWCVPSDTRTAYRDISLFDHLSTTSAIAACLYRYHWPNFSVKTILDITNRKFLLVAGDLSGIQSFLFEIGSTNPKKLSKILRGRSFYLSLLTEVASFHLLRILDLPISCRIMTAAGRFVLLVPNMASVLETLRSAIRSIQEWIFSRFLGKLTLNITSNTSLTMNDFKRDLFGRKYRVMGQDVERAKNQRYYGSSAEYQADGAIRNAYNTLLRDGEACEFCRVYPRAGEGKTRCRICLDSEELGRQLVSGRTRHLYIYDGVNPGRINILGYSLFFEKQSEDWLLMEKLDSEHEAVNPGYMKRQLARHIPRKDSGDIDLTNESPETGNSLCRYCSNTCSLNETTDAESAKIPARKDLIRETLTFQCMSAAARRKNNGKGVDHLAVLKADMDDTGVVFSQGLGDNFSISRYATLSRMINYFFTGWLASEIERSYPMAYTVYAGGDDWLILAPWEDALEIGRTIGESFQRYVGANPNLTISGGISLMRPDTPVAWAVKNADKLLEISKHTEDKGNFTFFNTTLRCDSFTEPYIFMTILHREYQESESAINASFLYRLLKYHEMYREATNGRIQCLRFHSAMSRDIRRNIEKRNRSGAVTNKEVVQKLKALCAVGSQFDKKLMDTLRIPVCWTLYKNRGGRRTMSMADAFKKAGYATQTTHSHGHNNVSTKPDNTGKRPPTIAFRSGGHLRRELLTDEASVWASSLSGVSITQLRNFYSEVKSLQARIETAGGFDKHSALVGMLKAKVAYAYARAEGKSKQGFASFKNMIDQCVDLSTSSEAFNDFALFYEAVLGFFREG